jgi:ribulose-5-phosphate 4-epimerase/fuculose-1-phosphate aldolase
LPEKSFMPRPPAREARSLVVAGVAAIELALERGVDLLGRQHVALHAEEKPRPQADLGQATYLMLRNHGLLTVGRTIPDAFLAMYFFESACRIQIDAMAGGAELRLIDEGPLRANAAVGNTATAGQGAMLAWPGLLRKLQRENPGFDT